MSTNGINNAEDADMADCDQEKVVTMMDVLKEQEEFEENANAVLGASDEKECTYSKGYIKRQALYACLTCCSDAKSDPDKCAGICLACSLNCHENHELVELYTKRNFRCDCGNPKFNSHPCTYTPEKTTLNEDNTYNQNFCGLYCTCHRPYPDPDCKVEEEMIQCVICEDWLHASHLEAALPPNEQYAEMICKGCMDKNVFLHDYSKYAVNYNENSIVDVVNDSAADISISNGDESHITIDQNSSIRMNAEVESANAENKIEVNGDKEISMEVDTKQDETEHSTPSSADVNNVTTGADDASSTANDSEVAVTETSISKSDLKETDETTTKNNEPITETSAESSKDTIETVKENPVEDANETKLVKSVEEGELKQIENTEGKSNVDESTSNIIDNTEEPATDQPEPIKDETISQIDELLGENDTKEKSVNESQLTNTENINEANGDTATKETCEAEIKLADEQSVSIEANKESVETNGDSSNPEENSDSKSAIPNDSIEPNKRKISTDRTDDDDEISTKKAKVDSGACTRPKDVRKVFKGATFWPSNFRQKLCTCNECTTMYKDLSVLFLTDLEDTVTYYEDLGKEKGSQPTQYEKGLQALSSLDRVQQINALTEYNIMKNRLVDFLKGYQDRQEIVKEEDIKAFFAGMKPKRESDGVYFCR